jgi:hypothetical protein
VRGGRKAARHWWERFRRRILTTTPSGVKLTPSTTTPSMAMMQFNAVVARMSFLWASAV